MNVPVPHHVLRHLVSIEEAHGTFSEAGASAMLALDAAAGRTRSVRDYARLWGWSKSRVQRSIGGLRAELGLDHPEPAQVGQKRDTSGTENAESAPESQNSGTRAGQQRDSSPPPLDGPPPSSPTPPPTTPPLSPPPDDDADDRARARLGFLAEDKAAVYRPAIEDLLARYAPSSLDMLVRNAWGRAATATGITNVLAQFREQEARHGPAAAFERVAAAVVIANLAAKPNELYTARVLEAFDNPRDDRSSPGRGTGGGPGRPGRGSPRRPSPAAAGGDGEASLDALVQS